MSWGEVADMVSAGCLLIGSLLSLAAAVGLIRFPDLFSRMHAATKPQSLGMLFILLGIGLRLRSPEVVGMLLLVALFQLLTAPVSSHMIGRAAYRRGPVRQDLLITDELADTLDSPDGDTGR